MYNILGVLHPYHKLWVTIIVELLTTLNSQNFLLRDVLWSHYQSERRHGEGVDHDIHRVQQRLQRPDLSIRRYVRAEGGCCEVVTPHREIHSITIVGDASKGKHSGGGFIAVDDQGHVLLWEVVTFSAQGLSTMIVEATMMPPGVHAITEWLRMGGIQVDHILVGSDNMAAVQRLQAGTLNHRPHEVMDLIVANVSSLTQPKEWVWIQAQHDTEDKDPLSCLNAIADEGARLGAGGDLVGYSTGMDLGSHANPRALPGGRPQKVCTTTTHKTHAGIQRRRDGSPIVGVARKLR